MEGMAQRMLLLESMFQEHKGEVAASMTDVTQKFAKVEEAVVGIGKGMDTVSAQVATQSAELAFEKKTLLDNLNAEFDKHQLALIGVVEDARREFHKMQNHLQELTGKTSSTFQEVRAKVESLEQEMHFSKGTTEGMTSSSRVGGAMNGFLPAKSLVPQVFKGEEDKWRAWQEDFADYLDGQRPGLKTVLKKAAEEPNIIDATWCNLNGVLDATHSTNVFRALKALTMAEARTVVQGVRNQCGFEAWRALHQRFGPSVAARQGRVMHDLSQMVSRPAKTPAETRSLVVELERRIRVAEEITGDSLGDGHTKSILAAILDPTTRAHTSAFQGSATKYHELKRVVLEFANNTAVASAKDHGGVEPMNIGCVADPASCSEVGATQDDEWEHVEGLSAVSPATQCHTCGGYGHIAAKCPTPKGGTMKGKGNNGKGDGKNKGTGKGDGGKGKGGGPKGGCWTCGGSHFASDCPSSWGGKPTWSKDGGKKGNGKGGKGFYQFTTADSYWPEPTVKPLCGLTQMSRPSIETGNRFAAFEEDEQEGQQQPTQKQITFGDFVPKGPLKAATQGEKKKERALLAKAPEERALLAKAPAPRLCPLVTIEPSGLAPVQEANGWEAIELAVDSGASETVIPETMIKGTELRPSPASQRGVEYEVANGERIPNLGQKSFSGITPDGARRSLTAQVCDVNKPLMSVARLVQSGHSVIFSQSGSRIVDDETGEAIRLHESNGMFMLRMWVPTSPSVAREAGF